MTSLTQNARHELIAAAVRAATGDDERRQLEWRGSALVLPVIRIPVAAVLLNPRTHRVSAQVRSLGPAGNVIAADPFGDEAQLLLAKLIRQTSGFDKVKSTIRRDKQLDPGLITHEGVLINGNTRAVALRDLHQELPFDEAKPFGFIKVQVLPEDALPDEIMQLEFDFQMRENVQQPYTFTNRLLFIRDLLDAGWSPENIGLQMNRSYNPTLAKDKLAAAREVETEDRLRQIIEEVIAASSAVLSWPDFDDDRQNLLEVDETYQAMSVRRGPEAARRVKQAKLVGLLAGVDYRRARHIDEPFLDGYILPALEEQPVLKTAAQALAIGGRSVRPGGVAGVSILDDLGDDPAVAPATVTLQPLFDVLVHAGRLDPDRDIDAEIQVTGDTGEPVVLPKSTFLDAVKLAMQNAADNKARDDQGQDERDLPRRHLMNAAAACDKVRGAYDRLEEVGEGPDRLAIEAALEGYLRAHDELIGYLAQRGFLAAENR